MSDYNSNMTEKMSGTITSAFKKTKLFEKIGKIELYRVVFYYFIHFYFNYYVYELF